MKLSNLCLLLILLGFSLVIYADNTNDTDTTSKEQVEVSESKPVVNKKRRTKTLKEFIPSEEVSADKPVAFPSDI